MTIIAAFLKKDCSYRNNCGIHLHDFSLEHSLIKEKIDVYMFFFPFLCSGISDLALGILKMLIRVCFRGVLQPTVCLFVPGMVWLSASLYSIYSKPLLFTNINYVKESFKLNEINYKSAFLYWWFSYTYNNIWFYVVQIMYCKLRYKNFPELGGVWD